jgi:flagellar hook-associated protein 3 FlgL
MTISRVSDAQNFDFLVSRSGQLQVAIRQLQEQIATGRRVLQPEDDPLGAAQVVNSQADIAGLAQLTQSTQFGQSVLGAQDDALGNAQQLLVRAREIATQESSGLLGPSERAAAAEEVHGLLQGLTALGNSELAGRRLFGDLALDGPAPFTDPDAAGYDPSTAYVGSTQEFSIATGSSASERVRISTRGGTVFGSSLTAVAALENALSTNGDVAGTLSGLTQASDAIDAERASVGARESELVDRGNQLGGLTLKAQTTLSQAQDADLTDVVARLTQAQTALQAVLATASHLAQTSLVSLLTP